MFFIDCVCLTEHTQDSCIIIYNSDDDLIFAKYNNTHYIAQRTGI